MTKRITIKNVAQKAGVSISTVSYVLNNTLGQTIKEETKERVRAAAKELGYTPNLIAKGLRSNQSHSIGVVNFWQLGDPIFADVFKGICGAGERAQYYTLMCKTDVESCIAAFQSRQIAGLIIISPYTNMPQYNEADFVGEIAAHKIPCVVINGTTQIDGASYVNMDYFANAYKATEYLINLKHTKIAFLLPHEKEFTHYPMPAYGRLEGYKAALGEYGLEFDENLCIQPLHYTKTVQSLKTKHLFTGIVANKAQYAYEFMGVAASEQLSIPEELSIISANFEPYAAYLSPPLTTVNLQTEQMGRIAVETLINALNKGISAVNQTPPCTLTVRQSCKML